MQRPHTHHPHHDRHREQRREQRRAQLRTALTPYLDPDTLHQHAHALRATPNTTTISQHRDTLQIIAQHARYALTPSERHLLEQLTQHPSSLKHAAAALRWPGARAHRTLRTLLDDLIASATPA